MANENEIAILTDRVAQIMNRARVTLANSVDALNGENFGRLLDSRMADIQALTAAAGPVQEAEFEAEAQRRFADRTQDPRDAEDAREARTDVLRPFANAQQEGQDFVRRINAAQEQLAGFRQDLRRSAEHLGEALNHVDTLKTFPESRALADELRTRVNHLGTLTVNADKGLQAAGNNLDNAKGAAQQFGRTEMEVDKYRLSNAIRETGASLQGDVTKSRDGLGTVRKDLAAAMPEVHESAEYSHKQAELADAVRAGLNPTPREAQTGDLATESGDGAQDPRLRLAQQASDINNER
jgi:hypothetical protein